MRRSVANPNRCQQSRLCIAASQWSLSEARLDRPSWSLLNLDFLPSVSQSTLSYQQKIMRCWTAITRHFINTSNVISKENPAIPGKADNMDSSGTLKNSARQFSILGFMKG